MCICILLTFLYICNLNLNRLLWIQQIICWSISLNQHQENKIIQVKKYFLLVLVQTQCLPSASCNTQEDFGQGLSSQCQVRFQHCVLKEVYQTFFAEDQLPNSLALEAEIDGKSVIIALWKYKNITPHSFQNPFKARSFLYIIDKSSSKFFSLSPYQEGSNTAYALSELTAVKTHCTHSFILLNLKG